MAGSAEFLKTSVAVVSIDSSLLHSACCDPVRGSCGKELEQEGQLEAGDEIAVKDGQSLNLTEPRMWLVPGGTRGTIVRGLFGGGRVVKWANANGEWPISSRAIWKLQKLKKQDRKEICSGVTLGYKGMRFGIALQWEVKEDGSLDGRNTWLRLKRLDTEACNAVVCLGEVRVLNQNIEKEKIISREGFADYLPASICEGICSEEGDLSLGIPLSAILDRSLGWLQDDTFRVECRILFRTDFVIGDTVRSFYDFGRKSLDTDKAIVKGLTLTEAELEFNGRKQTVPREWVVCFASGHELPLPYIPQADTVKQADFSNLLDDDSLADFTIQIFNVDEAICKELRVHRCVLCAKSAYFRKLMHCAMRESNQRKVQFSTSEAPALEFMLHFFYTGSFPTNLVDPQVVMATLVNAHFFDEPEALAICAKKLGSSLQVDSVCEVLQCAYKYDCAELICDCLVYLRMHIVDVSCTRQFQQMLQTHPEWIATCPGSAGDFQAGSERQCWDIKLVEKTRRLSNGLGCPSDFLRHQCPTFFVVHLPGGLYLGAEIFYIGDNVLLHTGKTVKYRQGGRVSGPSVCTGKIDVWFDASLISVDLRDVTREDPGLPGGLQCNSAVYVIADPNDEGGLQLHQAGLVLEAYSKTQVSVLFDGEEDVRHLPIDILSEDQSVLPGGWRAGDIVFLTREMTASEISFDHTYFRGRKVLDKGLCGRVVGPVDHPSKQFSHIRVQFEFDSCERFVRGSSLSTEKPQLCNGWRTHDIGVSQGGKLGVVVGGAGLKDEYDEYDSMFNWLHTHYRTRPKRRSSNNLLKVYFFGDMSPTYVPSAEFSGECSWRELLHSLSHAKGPAQLAVENIAPLCTKPLHTIVKLFLIVAPGLANRREYGVKVPTTRTSPYVGRRGRRGLHAASRAHASMNHAITFKIKDYAPRNI